MSLLNKKYLSPFTIILADPNPFMRSVTRQVLATFGAEKIIETDSIKSLIGSADLTEADLIIAELFFSDGSLLEFMKETRASLGKEKFIPVLLISAYTMRSWIFAARDAGIDEIIAKPLTVKSIISRIKEVVENRRAFIETAKYFGPDRRRRAGHPPTNKERRINPQGAPGKFGMH